MEQNQQGIDTSKQHSNEQIEDEKQMCVSTLTIELMDDTSNGEHGCEQNLRYISIKEPSGYENIYAMLLENNVATLCLEGVAYGEIVITQLDENQNQLNSDGFWGSEFYVDDQCVGYNDATIEIASEALTVRIIHKPCNRVSLNIEQVEQEVDVSFALCHPEYGSAWISLNQENHYTDCFLDLIPGEYSINSIEADTSVTFYLNRCPLKEGEIFMLENENNMLDIESTNYPPATLIVDQFIRSSSNELVKPHYDETFAICIRSTNYKENFILQASNDFCLRLCDLREDCYEIEVLDVNADISFVMNQEETCCNKVMVYANDITNVRVILSNTKYSEQTSPLRICKYVRRSNQQLVKPDPNTSFKVMLKGCGNCETFNLNAANNFCVDIEHICCGEYEVCEIDHEGYFVSYQVNDECESTRACFYIHEGYNTCVQVINEEKNRGQVTICKYIQDKNGCLVKPNRNNRYLVTLRSFFCCETFVLDASNDFCVHVSNLKEGSYEVKERCVEGYETTYSIDGGKEERKARFVVMNQCCVDVKIIGTQQKITYGDLRISKYIANAYGEYAKPAVNEEFQVKVSGSNFDEVYTLRAANQWCIILEGLARGTYQIEEVQHTGYATTYFVNKEQVDTACVTMEGCNQEVDIINTRCNYGDLKINVWIDDCNGNRQRPNPQEFFEVIVETTCDCDVYRLDASNHFCVYLENMPKGRVRITQKDSYGYRVLYDVNHQLMNQAIVYMEKEDIEIHILNQMMHCSGIVTVNAYTIDEFDNEVELQSGDCVSFQLQSRCLNHKYTLDQYNDFCVFFDDLEEGNYEIIARSNRHNIIGYRINGTECDCGRFVLRNQDIQVDILLEELPMPNVYVRKRILEQENLVKPQSCESFRFLLKGRNTHEMYELNEENDWCICLSHLKNQHYEIQELDVNCKVSYDINGEVHEIGYFLYENENMEITIINEEELNTMVQFQVKIDEGCNQYVTPSKLDQFEVMIESSHYKQCLNFNYQNQFQLLKEYLPNGYYTITNGSSYKLKQILINHQIQDNFQFCVDDQDLEVTLIFEENSENGICIQTEDECPMQSQYEIQIEHANQSECYVLQCENDFSMELNDIIPGNYRIYACNENVSFKYRNQLYKNMVDICVEDAMEHVFVVDEVCIQPSITIQYRMQGNAGSTFDKDETFQAELFGPTNKTLYFNASNEWKQTLKNVVAGVYEIVSDYENVMYQVNQQEKSKKGYFTVGTEAVQIIIWVMEDSTQPDESAQLTVHALVKNCEGNYETADQEQRFFVEIDGPNVQEDITLTHRNGFVMSYNELPQGFYEIRQLPNTEFENVTYRINGQETNEAKFELKNEPMQIDMINHMPCKLGSIQVRKYIQDASCGCLKSPNKDDEFEIVLASDGQEETILLSVANQWEYTFENVGNGNYRIYEKSQDQHVSYIVNNGKQQEEARIEVNNDSHVVKVINHDLIKGQGRLEIIKVLRDIQGNYRYPDEDAMYWVQIRGNNFLQRVLLTKDNRYYAVLDGLSDGIYEIVEEDNNPTYIINEKESNQGFVTISQNTQTVYVVNQNDNDEDYKITISKWMLPQEGQPMIPPNGEYRVQIERPNFTEMIVLNEENQYQSTIQLEQGSYIVKELGYEDAIYEVDGKQQTNQAMIIVPKTKEIKIWNHNITKSGEIVFEKLIRNEDGSMSLPTENQIFYIHLSKPSYNEVFTLNQGNQWKHTISNLEDGIYTINEIGNEDVVTYQIDGGSEQDYGEVSIQNDAHDVKIINAKNKRESGSITIEKWIRKEGLQKPSKDYVAEVHVSKPGYNQTFVLNYSNHWTIHINDLENGIYVIQELGSENKVVWQIDDGYEVAYAEVNVNADSHNVKMINIIENGSSILHISKRINVNGNLQMPEKDEIFQVEVIHDTTQQIELSDKNNWHEKLTNLPNGAYQIKEISNQYQTRYSVNDGPLQEEATIMLQDDEQQVRIINEKKDIKNQLVIHKYIKNSGGQLIPPADGDEYVVEVQGENYKEAFRLNESNQFMVAVNELQPGFYTVTESQLNEEFVVSYRLNGGNEVKKLVFEIKENGVYRVEVINELRDNLNSLDVYKYMRDANGNFVKPSEKQVFLFLLTGNNYNQYFTLNQQNNWHVEIDSLSSGIYEIIEQGSGSYDVQYVVNGADLSKTAQFEASAGKENIVEIINLEYPKNDGRLTIEKKIRTKEGNIVTPGNQQSFRIQLTNKAQNFSTTILLNETDGYLQTIENLPYGTYTLKEDLHSDYDTTFIVNNQEETQGGVFRIIDDQMQNVEIINSEKRTIDRVESTMKVNKTPKKAIASSNISIVLE